MSPSSTSNVLSVVGVLVLIVVIIATPVGAMRARSWPLRVAILILVPVIGAIVLWMIAIQVSGLNGP